jgi:hypothetical protein
MGLKRGENVDDVIIESMSISIKSICIPKTPYMVQTGILVHHAQTITQTKLFTTPHLTLFTLIPPKMPTLCHTLSVTRMGSFLPFSR